ncbi:MAG: TVP38/TMEM64 family protein [Mariprofundaceae bacterium]|nr:TVP38/TMEM64 family protein [Mariprofundaceae bacterium]
MSTDKQKSGFSPGRVLPLVVLAAGLGGFFAFDLDAYLSFSALAEHRQTLLSWVSAHLWLAPLAYIAAYIVVVAFSLPGGAVMTISGGFLFGSIAGGVYAVIGATLGATALFLVAKSSLGDFLLAKAGPVVKKMQAGFEANAWSYMFVLRLVPVFPFFLVNLAPAFLGVPLRIYVVATLFGILPATFVFALVGAGLGSVFDSGQAFSIQGVMTPEMIAALTGMALLALLPVVYKKIQGKRSDVAGGA